jgi:hypothetical protein
LATLTRSTTGAGSGVSGGGGIGVGTTVGAGVGAARAAADPTTMGRSARRGAANQETPTTTNTASASPTTADGQWIGAESVALTERNLDVTCEIAIPMTA